MNAIASRTTHTFKISCPQSKSDHIDGRNRQNKCLLRWKSIQAFIKDFSPPIVYDYVHTYIRKSYNSKYSTYAAELLVNMQKNRGEWEEKETFRRVHYAQESSSSLYIHAIIRLFLIVWMPTSYSHWNLSKVTKSEISRHFFTKLMIGSNFSLFLV